MLNHVEKVDRTFWMSSYLKITSTIPRMLIFSHAGIKQAAHLWSYFLMFTALPFKITCIAWVGFKKNDSLFYLASDIQNDRISLDSTGGLFHDPFIPTCIVSPRTLQSHHSLEALALNFSILVAQNMKTFA